MRISYIIYNMMDKETLDKLRESALQIRKERTEGGRVVRHGYMGAFLAGYLGLPLDSEEILKIPQNFIPKICTIQKKSVPLPSLNKR